MWNPKKSARFSLILTYIFMALLLIGICTLPAIVTWYVEVRGRAQSLPTTIMLTCYPCVPFAAIMLWSLRKLLKNIIADRVFCEENVSLLRRISWCCFAVMAIMLFSGRFYLPFYVCAMSAAFLGLILRVVKNLFHAAAPEKASDTVPLEDESRFQAEDE